MLKEIELFCCLTCSGDAMDDDGSMDCLGCENNEPSMKFMILRCKRDVMLHVSYIHCCKMSFVKKWRDVIGNIILMIFDSFNHS